MAEFTSGDEVSFRISDRHQFDGSEITGKIVADYHSNTVRVEVPGDQTHHYVSRSELLRAKGPFFDVRGQVMTMSPTHKGEVGEIVATGESASGKPFFKVRFQSDKTDEWFGEDQVFIADSDSDGNDAPATNHIETWS